MQSSCFKLPGDLSRMSADDRSEAVCTLPAEASYPDAHRTTGFIVASAYEGAFQTALAEIQGREGHAVLDAFLAWPLAVVEAARGDALCSAASHAAFAAASLAYETLSSTTVRLFSTQPAHLCALHSALRTRRDELARGGGLPRPFHEAPTLA
jgi:hypothetical protein